MTERPSTLVYVGAHLGGTLATIYYRYDIVYAFEPDPITFRYLERDFSGAPGVTLVNAACAQEDGVAEFHLFNYRQSSSLSIGNPAYLQEDSQAITVKTVNLMGFLSSHGVEYIDLYQSDIQGADLMVLKTIEPFVREKRIGMMEIETNWDGERLYTDFDNSLGSFRSFLEPEYYASHAFIGGPARHEYARIEHITEYNTMEWDTVWLPTEE